ncbi:MAG: MFS transporter [Candidatus Bipolaricaulia bacterium]
MTGEGRRSARFHYGLIILLMSVLVVMGALGFARFGYTMILPSMKEGLRLSYTQMGLLATGNFLGYLIFALVGGFLASRFGPRLIISSSLLLIGITMFLTGLAPNFSFALAMRILTGIGSGGSNVPVMGLASAWFAARRRGMATGLIAGGSGLGLIITGPLVPTIIARYGPLGWRYSWYFLGLAVLALGLSGYIILRNRPQEKRLRPIGETEEDRQREREAEPSSSSSLQWGLVYRSGSLWHLALIYSMFGFSYIIYATFFAAYLVKEVQFTEAGAGSLWALVGFLSIASGFLWGSVSDRLGRKWGLVIVFSLQGLSFLVFALAKSVPGAYLSTVLFGLTAWSIPAIMAAACGDYLGSRLAPAALGLITLIFGIGQALGPSVAGYIADVTASFTMALLIAAIAAFLGMTGSLLLKPHR